MQRVEVEQAIARANRSRAVDKFFRQCAELADALRIDDAGESHIAVPPVCVDLFVSKVTPVRIARVRHENQPLRTILVSTRDSRNRELRRQDCAPEVSLRVAGSGDTKIKHRLVSNTGLTPMLAAHRLGYRATNHTREIAKMATK